ncbi:MAG TPA: hypothetical protein VFX83_09060 [Azonexus sp.]|nr:hypothetical protein [Azonexus sp.]
MAQLAYLSADGALGLTQFVGSFLAVCLGIAELLLQGLQPAFEGVELGLLAGGLVGAGTQRPDQCQQDEK